MSFHFNKQVPHNKAGNLKKAKVPSSLKGKLGHKRHIFDTKHKIVTGL